jgi:hypothetical protein
MKYVDSMKYEQQMIHALTREIKRRQQANLVKPRQSSRPSCSTDLTPAMGTVPYEPTNSTAPSFTPSLPSSSIDLAPRTDMAPLVIENLKLREENVRLTRELEATQKTIEQLRQQQQAMQAEKQKSPKRVPSPSIFFTEATLKSLPPVPTKDQMIVTASATSKDSKRKSSSILI